MSETAMQVFDFEGHNSRIITDENGELWFVAKDVLEILEYTGKTNTFAITSKVPAQWKGNKRIITPGGTQEMLCLSESGLYFFLGRSDKPKALPYQMKVAGEVMPSIRKKGGFALPGSPMDMAMLIAEAVDTAVAKRFEDIRKITDENLMLRVNNERLLGLVNRYAPDRKKFGEISEHNGQRKLGEVKAHFRTCGKTVHFITDVAAFSALFQPQLPFPQTHANNEAAQ